VGCQTSCAKLTTTERVYTSSRGQIRALLRALLLVSYAASNTYTCYPYLSEEVSIRALSMYDARPAGLLGLVGFIAISVCGKQNGAALLPATG
jgi:hypothetical protein